MQWGAKTTVPYAIPVVPSSRDPCYIVGKSRRSMTGPKHRDGLLDLGTTWQGARAWGNARRVPDGTGLRTWGTPQQELALAVVW